MSVKSKTELLSLIDQIPVLPTAFLSHYVCQLYYTLNDALITVNDIKLQENHPEKENFYQNKTVLNFKGGMPSCFLKKLIKLDSPPKPHWQAIS